MHGVIPIIFISPYLREAPIQQDPKLISPPCLVRIYGAFWLSLDEKPHLFKRETLNQSTFQVCFFIIDKLFLIFHNRFYFNLRLLIVVNLFSTNNVLFFFLLTASLQVWYFMLLELLVSFKIWES